MQGGAEWLNLLQLRYWGDLQKEWAFSTLQELEQREIEVPNLETSAGATATTTEVVGFSALLTGSGCSNLAVKIVTLAAFEMERDSAGRSSSWSRGM